MFKALSRLFGSKPKKAPRISLPLAREEIAAPAAVVPGVPIRAMEPPPPEAKPAAPPAPVESSAREKWKIEAATAAVAPAEEVSPEELCGITPGMNSMEIRERISKLYQRHNRAASSLDPKLREEAEFMLETLAGLREKHLGNSLPS